MTTLHTERLVLRPWVAADRDGFAALNADPVVMEHFPSVMTREASDAQADRIAARIEESGWGFWALEVPGITPFAGFTGLLPVVDLPVRPAYGEGPLVEVGWRLARAYWGRGYAPEAARSALAFAWDELGLDEVVSFTTTLNANSRRVMEKIGLVRDESSDFDHPRTPGWHGQRHVTYRAARPAPDSVRP